MNNINIFNFRAYVLTTVLLFIVAAGILLNSSAAVADVIRIGGTGSALGTARILASAFEKKYPDIRVKVLPSIGSSGAINAVSQGALEIGLISRQLKNWEVNLGLRVTDFSRTPFVLVAQRNVSVSSLRHEDLVKIYKGEENYWPDGERIRIVLRPAADADTIIARSISFEMSAAIDRALSREGMLIALTNQENMEIIEKTPGALGFSSLAHILTECRTPKILSYNGVFPSRKNLLNGTYPLSLKHSFVTKPHLSRSLQYFIDFVHSRRGMEILEKSGCIPIKGKE